MAKQILTSRDLRNLADWGCEIHVDDDGRATIVEESK